MRNTRRQFIGSVAAPAVLRGRTAKQNVLFIAIDDLNDWVGCLGGHPGAITPNLDRLAARGVLFTNAHCAAPLCNPSRAALMTGIRPSTSGIYTNNPPRRKAPALASAVTLSQHFMQSGYRVAGGGKIYHGSFPDPQSWHEYYPSQTRNKPPDPNPETRPANGIPGAAQFDWGPLDVSDSAMGDYKVVEWAASELSRKQEKPFFLACGIFRPHLPWYVPRKYFDMHPLAKIVLPKVNPRDLDDVPPVGRKFARPEGDHAAVVRHDQWARAVQAYQASITFADAQVGRVLDALERGPHAGNTAVVLWSDHGWHLGEKLHWRKFTLWEEATRNVLMISAPGLARGRSGRPVSLLDIYPTLIDLCGLPPRAGLEGSSLMRLLRDPAAPRERPSLTTYQRGNHSVRGERWRYTRYHDGSEELYDHEADPLEWTNLAGRPEHAGVKRDLARWLPARDAPNSAEERRGAGAE